MRARTVIPIDYEVKKVLLYFVRLFPTYEKAAEAIGVNRSTIAIYMEGAENISSEVLEAVISVVEKQVPQAEIQGQLGADWRKKIRGRSRQRNFLQTDNEALELGPALHRFLDLYTSQFSSRIRAARSLSVNPRTYKAYVKKTIATLPRRVFEDALKNLKEKGFTTASICEAVGVEELTQIALLRERPATLYMEDEPLIEALISFHSRGGRSLRQEAKPLYNLCQRRFGGTRAAIAALMTRLALEVEKGFLTHMEEGEIDEALTHLKKLDRALPWFSAQLKMVDRTRSRTGDPRWWEEVLRYESLRSKMAERLRREAPFTHDYMVKSEVEQFRFRHPHTLPFRPYDHSESYEDGELIYHSAFGLGRVLGRPEKNKIGVRFPKSPQVVFLTSEEKGR